MFVPSSSRRPPSGAADGIFIQWGRRQPAKSYTTVSHRGKQSDLREDNPMNLRSAPKLWLAFVVVAAALAAGKKSGETNKPYGLIIPSATPFTNRTHKTPKSNSATPSSTEDYPPV